MMTIITVLVEEAPGLVAGRMQSRSVEATDAEKEMAHRIFEVARLEMEKTMVENQNGWSRYVDSREQG